MANPTTNYGWPMPTSTDLVTDLPADFAAFGQPVDTSLKALNPETTLGDIAYRSATSNTNTRLGIGTNGQVLAVSGGVPAWTTTADVTPLTTKGDLFTFTTVDARLGVGANNTVLTADSAEATGMKWATAGSAFSGCSVFKDSTTSVPNATEVFIDFNDESFDTDAFHSNVTNPERITIPAGKGGKYQLNARITTSSTQATALSLYLIKNAGTYIGECTIDMQRGGTVQIAQLLSAVATDYFRIMIYQQSGATITMNSGQQGTNFSMAYLGA